MSGIVRQDDPAISDAERLFGRVHLKQIVKDEDTGMARVSSGAFRDPELSVDIESVLVAHGLNEKHCLLNHDEHRLVSLTAGGCRQFQQAVCADPVPGNPAHGLVYRRKSRANSGKLARFVPLGNPG